MHVINSELRGYLEQYSSHRSIVYCDFNKAIGVLESNQNADAFIPS